MNSAVIDVLIGVVYAYVFFSMLASGVVEWIARLRHVRAEMLHEAIRDLLASSNVEGSLFWRLYEHPLITGLQNDERYPSYIPASNFALALIDLAIDFTTTATAVTAAPRANLNVREKALISSLISRDGSPRTIQSRIEKWFDGGMERLSGYYKRKTYVVLLVVSLALSFAFGVDTLRLANDLYRNSAVREAAVQVAVKASAMKDPAMKDSAMKDPAMKDPAQLPAVQLPIGWLDRYPPQWFIPGCLVTGLALTFGAPFWFDLLGRLVNLRQTGVPPNLEGKIVAH